MLSTNLALECAFAFHPLVSTSTRKTRNILPISISGSFNNQFVCLCIQEAWRSRAGGGSLVSLWMRGRMRLQCASSVGRALCAQARPLHMVAHQLYTAGTRRLLRPAGEGWQATPRHPQDAQGWRSLPQCFYQCRQLERYFVIGLDIRMACTLANNGDI